MAEYRWANANRSTMRGAPLRPECRDANTTTRECGPNDRRTFCRGVWRNGIPEVVDGECLACGAYDNNISPLWCCPVGTYGCSIAMTTPEGKGVSIDRCLADEVSGLWERGIETLGCCCGHGARTASYIQVVPEHCAAMGDMGYRRQPEIVLPGGDVMGSWCFRPKTGTPPKEPPC